MDNMYSKKYTRNISSLYPNIEKWCKENKILNVKMFAAYIEEKTGERISYFSLIRALNGEKAFKMQEISILIRCTGIAYEELFKKLGDAE